MDYTLIRSSRRTVALEIREDGLLVRAPMRMTETEIEAFLMKHRRWIFTHMEQRSRQKKALEAVEPLTPEDIRALAQRAGEVIPHRVAHYAPLVGVSYGRITIRAQKTRWGSCSAKGNLNFNCLLMLAPPEVLDSVVVHELCHRKEMDHSDSFYREVLRVCPDYWERHRWLKENGGLLIRRMTEGQKG